ncbi:MAG: N(2)-acetyl-L-2,4-diaminobutanoate deacetylase DoeB2 [Planctomycetota bacterium]|jgi:amidohydrolase|nr:N(2)-acetyl-L-2,4-diaminobutanoate deacetylase DoeB2 [Planctomycetota bacterium]
MSETWSDLIEHAVATRRALHREPELAWQETDTAAAIREQLDHLSIPWRACAHTGTVAVLNEGAPGRHIALRADIDALPIEEATGAEWSSRHPGLMHACGHDGHTATLLAAAGWLKRHEDLLPGPVTLLFQPAEEGGHGADKMIAGGALDGVDLIFGWHNWPAIPEGRAVCPDGPVMCANGSFVIELTGSGGHASQPELCRDPVLAASAITLALQQIVSRRIAPQEPAVVSVASIMADSMDTIIPERATLRGSVRAASTASRDWIEAQIDQIATATAAAYGVEAVLSHKPRYGATVNHPEAAAEMRDALAAELGASWCSQGTPLPIMASEDFSYYLERIPGAFALVGAGQAGGSPPCHSPAYDFNDSLIPVVARLYARLAGIPLNS